MSAISLSKLAQEKRASIVRIVCMRGKKIAMTGTGFFIDDSYVLTCAHVLLCNANIASLLEAGDKLTKESASLEQKLKTHFLKSKITVFVETEKGKRMKAKSVSFNGSMDVGLVSIQSRGVPVEVKMRPMKIGETIMSLGFPYTIQTADDKFPFSAVQGIVMSQPKVQIGGYLRRLFTQIYCPSMGGASGSPVFDEQGFVIGILNGQMRWGDDNFLFRDENAKDSSKIIKDAFHVPLPYGFVTPLQKIWSKVESLKSK